MQRHDVASTFSRRCINVMCPLGSYCSRYSTFPTGRSKAVLLLQLLFVHAFIVSYVTFVLSFFVPNLSFRFLENAVLRECGISSVFSLIIFLYSYMIYPSSWLCKGTQYEKMAIIVYAGNEDPEQLGRLHSLIRVIIVL